MADQKPIRNEAREPGRYQQDARLKSFLRQAVAIIASERGLNAQSRLKLESLARHQKLPDDLFVEAIRQLQGDEARIPRLNRYEKEFVKYLDKEFKKIRSGVISLRMEQNAIELADKKFQIPPIRAEWLIEQQAKASSIGRLSRGEAEQYATQFIAERVGDRSELDSQLTEEIYERGHKLGLTRDRVDTEIARLLEINRFGESKRSRKGWLVAGILLLALTGMIVGGYTAGWVPFALIRTPEIPSEPPTPVESIVAERSAPGWMTASTKELVVNVANEETRSPSLVSDLLSEDPVQRQSGYRQLAELACQNSSSGRKQVEQLILTLFREEPDQSVAFEFIETFCAYIKLPDQLTSISVAALERQFRANRLLGLIYYYYYFVPQIPDLDGAVLDEAERKLKLAQRIFLVNGIQPENLLMPEFISQSERGISVDQWNFLIQNNWESPSRAALLVQPLCDLTRARLPADSLNKFRFRLLQSILNADDRQWLQLQRPVRESIFASDEVELIEWIELFEISQSMAFREYLGPLLIQQANIEARSSRVADVSASLQSYVSSYRNRILQPFLVRNERIAALTDELSESLGATDIHTPDQIAQIAFLTNANLAFCQQIRQNKIATDESFSRLDQMLARPRIRLRELISLAGKSTPPDTAMAPTASDINRKNDSLEKIRNLSTVSARSRINALLDLEKIAPRFEDLAYSEASILARYFLADLADEEALNIQRIITAFAEWPSLGLAVADQINQQNLSLDRALTIARLLFNTEFEVSVRDQSWPDKLQYQMIAAVAERTQIRLEKDNTNSQSDWNRLELFLADIYRERFELMTDEMVDAELLGRSVNPSEILFAIIDKKLQKLRGMSESTLRIRRAKNLIQLESYNEMEKTIVANQLLFELLAQTDAGLPEQRPNNFTQLSERFESNFESSTGLVNQMFLVHQALLEFVALRRQQLAEDVIEKR